MMTREEAIKHLRNDWFMSLGGQLCVDEDKKDAFLEAVGMGIKALRPVSREQVEKVWGFGGWETVPDQGFVDTMGRQVYHLHCHHCGFFWREKGHAKYFKFCPACGAPMTDEAVEMVMERLEALHSETKAD